MRVTISSGIGSLLSVMTSHVRSSINFGADALHPSFLPPAARRRRPLPGPCPRRPPVGGVPQSRIGSRSSSIFFPDRKRPLATQSRRALSIDLAGQGHPVTNRPRSEPPRPLLFTPSLPAAASLQGRVQILVKTGKCNIGDRYCLHGNPIGGHACL